MPEFKCPICGASYLISAAFCDFDRGEIRVGNAGYIESAPCVDCLHDIRPGNMVTIKGGWGTFFTGLEFPEDKRLVRFKNRSAMVLGISTSPRNGSIFLLEIDDAGKKLQFYATRGQIKLVDK